MKEELLTIIFTRDPQSETGQQWGISVEGTKKALDFLNGLCPCLQLLAARLNYGESVQLASFINSQVSKNVLVRAGDGT
jgi:hypothetical protein